MVRITQAPPDKKRLSLIVSQDTYEVLAALAQLHGISMNEIASELLTQFAKKNSAAISAVEEVKKSAQKNFPVQMEFNFDTKKAAE